MKEQSKASPDDNLAQAMNCIFYPKSVAIIGVSRDSEKEKKTGWVGRLLEFGYQGKIYPINPNATNLVGLTAYPSVKDIPDSVDYAIVAVPRHIVPQAVADCVSKGVKAVHVYTAGFAETGDEEGKRLQAEIERTISGSNTRLIGPNCLGVYCPASGLTFYEGFSKEPGPIAFISQTGVGGRRLIGLANGKGLRFSKMVSYGNGIDLNVTDFLEYVMADTESKYILLYVEGLKDGRRFFELVRECAAVKPVVLLKAGLSESGAGAVASHTASLAGSREVWQTFFRQTGVIAVETLEEAAEQLVAVANIPSITGRNVGLVGRGGGIGCIAADMCEREGLKVPAFTTETKSQLAEITPASAGSSVRNPVEIGMGRWGLQESYAKGLQIVAADPQIDMILTFLNPEDYIKFGIGNWVDDISQQLIETAQTLPKPLAVAFLAGHDVDVFKGTWEIQRRCQKAGVACFPTLDVAIKALSKLTDYYEFKSRLLDSA
ncbi:acetate--CoA ligase family protein [Chloroflexota bacterium]